MRGIIYLAVAATAWGTGGAVAALLYRDTGLSPVSVSWWRFVIGLVLLGAMYAFRTHRQAPAATKVRGSWWRLGGTGIGLAVSQWAYFAAVGPAGVAIATVVTIGVTPLVVALGTVMFRGQRVRVFDVTVLAVALAGLTLLTLSGSAGGPRILAGIGLSLLSAVAYAGVILLRTDKAGDDPLKAALVGFAIGTLVLLPFAISSGIGSSGDPMWTVMFLLYLGAIPTALAYGLFFSALTRVAATTAAMLTLIEPLTAAAIAIVFLHESLTTSALMGGLVLLTAMAAYVRYVPQGGGA